MQSADASLDFGTVAISPNSGRAGDWGTWVVTYTVGSCGIATGGGLQVALPERWHQWWRNSARRLQSVDPTAPYYVTAHTDRPGVRLHFEVLDASEAEYVKTFRTNVGYPPGSRYSWTVSVTVTEGALHAGDTINVVYGDMSHGGRGFTPPLWPGSPEHVRAAVDATGEGTFALLPDGALPLLHSEPGPPVELLLVLESRSVASREMRVRMVALDEFHNPVPAPDTAIYLVVAAGAATLPSSPVKLGDASTWGCREFTITPTAVGVLRLRGTSQDGRLYGLSNPSKVFATSVETDGSPVGGLYWGDIHSHSQYSWDGTGTRDDHFRYARYASLLDVYCATDHNDRRSMSQEDWQQNVAYTGKWNAPGKFATILGYEASFGAPYGHHNVYYRGSAGPLHYQDEENPEEIWERAAREQLEGEMFTIPHHTGGFARPGGGVKHDWRIHDPRFRPTIEIYSSHGLSEEYAPDHPISMDVSDFTFNGPGDPGNYAVDAWLAGLKFGVIGSSDNHGAQPGKEGFGTMAVWAPELTREAAFDAIRNRRTYGSTGSRIYLEFAVNGEPMGSEATITAREPVAVHVEALGTGPLRWIHVLRADLDRPEAGFSVVHKEWFPGGSAPMDFSFDWTDDTPPARAIYYVRVRQRDLVHGRVAQAWSSPVWVTRD